MINEIVLKIKSQLRGCLLLQQLSRLLISHNGLVISKVRLMIVIPNHTRLGQRQGEFPKADHYEQRKENK